MAPTALAIGTPTLYPDLGQGSDTHLLAVLDAAVEAGFSGLSIFGAHIVNAVECLVADQRPERLEPPADRRDAIPRFRAALARAPDVLTGSGADDVRGWFASRNLTVHSIECLSQWPTGDDALAMAEAEAACVAAELLDAPQIVAVCLQADAGRADLAAGLRAVARVARAHGRAIAVEWLPGTSLPSLAEAKALVDAVDATNIGFVIDTLHWQCQPGGPDWSLLATIPGELLFQLQLSDCSWPLAPGVVEPPQRLLPGDGRIDLRRVARSVIDANPDVVVMTEVFDEGRLMRDGVAGDAVAQSRSARALLDQLG